MSNQYLDIIKDCLNVQTLNQEAIENVVDSTNDGQQNASLELLYGETPLESVPKVLDAIKDSLPDDIQLKGDGSEVFLDIGCGRGHVTLASSACFKWKKCCGIELVEEHCVEAEKAKQKLLSLEQKNEGALPTKADDIEFLCADVLRDEKVVPILKDADLVYCYDMAFPFALRQNLASVLSRQLKDGALVLSTHLDILPSADFVKVGSLFSIEFSWGNAPAQLYRKQPGALLQWLEKHQSQLEHWSIPRGLWPSLCVKMIEQTIDIGSYIQLCAVDSDANNSFVVLTNKPLEKEKVAFILDHCWSFESKKDALKSLSEVPGLKTRISAMCKSVEEVEEATVENIFEKAKSLLGSYTIKQSVDQKEPTTVFYMLDEVGSRLRRKYEGDVVPFHEGNANMKMVPFYSFDHRIAFSIAFPIKDVAKSEFLFADHEQGWKKDEHVLIPESANVEAAILPEMKEYSAQVNLQQMIKETATKSD